MGPTLIVTELNGHRALLASFHTNERREPRRDWVQPVDCLLSELVARLCARAYARVCALLQLKQSQAPPPCCSQLSHRRLTFKANNHQQRRAYTHTHKKVNYHIVFTRWARQTICDLWQGTLAHVGIHRKIRDEVR